MKPHRMISRVLLLILLLSPIAPRAFGNRISAPSCHILTRLSKQARTHRADSSFHRVLITIGHRSPTQRIHRLRGKRINLGTAYVPFCAASLVPKEATLRTALPIQERSGPNSPRAPPLLSI